VLLWLFPFCKSMSFGEMKGKKLTCYRTFFFSLNFFLVLLNLVAAAAFMLIDKKKYCLEFLVLLLCHLFSKGKNN
jgi:hypothetical protein